MASCPLSTSKSEHRHYDDHSNIIESEETDIFKRKVVTVTNYFIMVLKCHFVDRTALLQAADHQATGQEPRVRGDVPHRRRLSQRGDHVPEDVPPVRRAYAVSTLLPRRQ